MVHFGLWNDYDEKYNINTLRDDNICLYAKENRNSSVIDDRFSWLNMSNESPQIYHKSWCYHKSNTVIIIPDITHFL